MSQSRRPAGAPTGGQSAPVAAQKVSIGVRVYARVRRVGLDTAEAIEAHRLGINLGAYVLARQAGATHAEAVGSLPAALAERREGRP